MYKEMVQNAATDWFDESLSPGKFNLLFDRQIIDVV